MVTTATRPLVMHGVLGGIIAGLVFAAFEMLASAMLMGLGAFFMPLRMIAAIVMGEGVLDPTTSLMGPLVVGVLVHLALSAAFGVALAYLAPTVVRSGNGAAALVIAASVFGFLLWIVNFYIIAPIAGWYWFPERTNAIVQFLAHTFAFGSVLGFYLHARGGMATGPVRAGGGIEG